MTLLQAARQERDALVMALPPSSSMARSPLLSSLLTLHRALSSSSTVDAGLVTVRRQTRAAGRRLEDLLDVDDAPADAVVVTRFVEPDLLPLTDALATFIGRAARARFTPWAGDGQSETDALPELGDAVAAVVEQELGPALLSLGLFGFEVPRPFVTHFDPRRHQVVERASGPISVVVDVHRFGRIGLGGRLNDPSLVVVGGGS